MKPTARGWWWILLVVSVGACTFNFSDEARYTCRTDAECGGDGFICALRVNPGLCCKPSGAEVCDGLDNDCDGLADNTGKAELCNGEDDDCNGTTDDGFDLSTNPQHCGQCGKVCAINERCTGGGCQVRAESQCFDGFDDDRNGTTDCGDASCEGRSCGAACVCRALQRAEALCSDSIDNEGDGTTDCADPDCLGKACRAGCECAAAGVKLEVDCTDGLDNDSDGAADCLDGDCLEQFCTPPDIYFQCTTDFRCRCNGGVQIAEVGVVLCRDGVDNDCDGEQDCGEASCEGISCAADGGLGCQCAVGGAGKREADCTNVFDDDQDGLVDCQDSDCPRGTPCTSAADGGVCTAMKTCG